MDLQHINVTNAERLITCASQAYKVTAVGISICNKNQGIGKWIVKYNNDTLQRRASWLPILINREYKNEQFFETCY